MLGLARRSSSRPGGSLLHPAVLGTILIGPGQARLVALGRKRSGRLIECFTALLGAGAEAEAEPLDSPENSTPTLLELDLSPALEVKVPGEFSAVPDSLVFHTLRFEPEEGSTASGFDPQQLIQDQLDQLADRLLPEFAGQTLRVAARDPAWQPLCREWVKIWVGATDRHNLHHGLQADANGLIRALGFSYLDVPPPPFRQPTPEPNPEPLASEMEPGRPPPWSLHSNDDWEEPLFSPDEEDPEANLDLFPEEEAAEKVYPGQWDTTFPLEDELCDYWEDRLMDNVGYFSHICLAGRRKDQRRTESHD